MILVTGAAGFIGSHFVQGWLQAGDEPVLSLDALTYAGDRANLRALDGDPRHRFVRGDVRDRALLARLLAAHRPRAIVHLAAESHVDRSIADAAPFVATNVDGSFALLEAARAHWVGLPAAERAAFRFLLVSTDEVYGSLAPDAPAFTEAHPLQPNNPYAATKAAADHLARAWQHTYGLPVLVTRSCDNYGPRQYPEKLIPRMITCALAGAPLPLYGDGLQVRDWLYVDDHCRALRAVLAHGQPGRVYNIGGGQERSNRELVDALCALLDELRPDPAGPYRRLLAFVADRAGHDRRYAVDARRIERELGWRPQVALAAGLRATVAWALAQPARAAAAGRPDEDGAAR